MIAAFEQGNLAEAKRLQSMSAQMVRVIIGKGGRAGFKATMAMIGADCGYSRLPLQTCSREVSAQIRQGLEEMGFFELLQHAS
ncbi:MAG: hypothetical protein RIQ93_3392 [Verrucomicrobiota bacterium]|jgi:N-acetylneuraminate lyase